MCLKHIHTKYGRMQTKQGDREQEKKKSIQSFWFFLKNWLLMSEKRDNSEHIFLGIFFKKN